MEKKYNGNKVAIILETFSATMILFLVVIPCIYLDKGNFIAYIFMGGIGLVFIGVITFIRLHNMHIILNQEKLSTHNAILGTSQEFKWNDVESIRFYPSLCTVNLRDSQGHGLSANYLIKDYKLAWRDIVLQAQESNPNIIVSPKLIKKLQKENLL